MIPKLIPLLLAVPLLLSPPAHAAVDLTNPGPWLVFGFALGWGMGPADYDGRGGVRFEVQASAEGGPFQRLFRAAYAQLRWFPYAENLSRYAGKEVRFRFLVEHLDGRIMMDYPHWGNPRVVAGPLVGSGPPTETFNFAMTPASRVAALLPDGTEAPLTEEDPIFRQGLVTPGRLNRDLMLLVYAGDNYICVPGKRQPGIYMGVSMSVDYLRIGAGPGRQPWTGKMPPPVFAEWTAHVPSAPAKAPVPGSPQAPPLPHAQRAPGVATLLQTRTDVYQYRPGLAASADSGPLALQADMGPEGDVGWAFAAMELSGVSEIPLNFQRRGRLTGHGDNAFAGLVLDYHSPRGYQDRVFLGLGVGSASRYDLRPAAWNLEGPPLTLARTMGMRSAFADLAGRAPRRSGSLRLSLARWAPLDWDGRIWLAAGVQDLPPRAGLTVRLTGLKVQTQVTARPGLKPLELQDASSRFIISRGTGAILAGWDLKSNRRLMVSCNDRYTMDTEHDVTRTTEQLDRVVGLDSSPLDGRPAARVTCANAALPGVTIEKRYILRPGRVLSKRTSFTTGDPRGFFVHWDAETALDEAFMAGSSRRGDLAARQVVAQGKVAAKTQQVAAEQVCTGDAPIVTLSDFSLGLSAYRFAVNDRYVLRGDSKGLPTGWLNTVFVDYLKQGKSASGEVRWVVFEGDFTAADRHYQALPEVRALWEFRHPEWVSMALADAMYLGPPETYPFYRACIPELVTTTIWFLNPPWGNWGPDNDPPKSLHPNVKGIAAGWRHEFPNARVSAYTNALFDDRSDIFKQHPEFGVRDLEGQLITSGIASDSGGRPTFYYQIDNPACRQYLLDMHAAKFKAWGFDFFYMDGPGFGAEVEDWATRQVVQSYDWLEYFHTLRERLQAIKPEAAVFVNGPNTPYTDFGYIEYRDEQWQALSGPNWRQLALELLRTKLAEPEGMVVVPTYGNVAADPALAAYDMLYGWMGHLCEVGRIPWMREAFRTRGSRLVEDAVGPRWWRTDAGFEAYGLRHGTCALVGVLDHATQPRTVTLRVDTGKLGLTEGKPLGAQLRLMNDTASDLRPDPADPKKQVRVYSSTHAATVNELFSNRRCPGALELTLPTRPMLTTMVVLSHDPEALR